MKKTIEFILTATAALSVALAGSAAQISGTDFESMNPEAPVQYNAPDQSTGASYWYTDAMSSVTNGVLVANDAEGSYSNSTDFAGYPNEYANSNHVQYLQLSTAEELKRTINASGVNGITPYSMAEEGKGTLYVDMLVKFTPSDIAPDSNVADKIVLWMDSASNLVVRAGYMPKSLIVMPKEYQLNGTFFPDKWYRLTIKSIRQAPYSIFFVVYVDGVRLSHSDSIEEEPGTLASLTDDAAKDAFNNNALFYSLVADSDTDEISYVSFTGVGSVDDISFTLDEPVFAGGGETLLSFTLALGEGLSGFEYVVGDGESANASGDVVTNVAANTVVTIKSITPADWYTNVASLSNATDGVTVDSVNTNFTVTADNATGVVSAVKASVADVVGTTVEGVSVEQLQAWANANGLDYSTIVAADATKTANAFLMNTSDLTADPVLKVASIVKDGNTWKFTFTKAASASAATDEGVTGSSKTGTTPSTLNIYGTIYVYESDDLSNWGAATPVTVTEGTVTITPTKNFFKFKVDVEGLGGGNNNN